MKKYFLTALWICAAIAPPASAQDKAPAAKPELTAQQQAFLNLPQEKRDEYIKHIGEGKRLLGEQRVFECLDEIAKARTIFTDDSDAYNLYGSCQIELRNFDKALTAFTEAEKLTPKNPGIRFNLSEVYFVTKKWDKAEAIYTELLQRSTEKDFPFPIGMIRLIEFKSLLCKIKLGKMEEAEILSEKYTFLDDSPFYFYAHAAMAYAKDDQVKAEGWLARSRKVYSAADLSSWQDTLVEFGYIQSFYGGDASQN